MRAVLKCDACLGRLIVTQLHKEAVTLKQLQSKLKVKSAKDSHFERYHSELCKMVEGLDNFCARCSDGVAEAEATDEAAAAEQLSAMRKVLEGLFSAAEHHLGGAKQARQRYATY